jgi:hypothetical protein
MFLVSSDSNSQRGRNPLFEREFSDLRMTVEDQLAEGNVGTFPVLSG